jgi:hypothetical protein
MEQRQREMRYAKKLKTITRAKERLQKKELEAIAEVMRR